MLYPLYALCFSTLHLTLPGTDAYSALGTHPPAAFLATSRGTLNDFAYHIENLYCNTAGNPLPPCLLDCSSLMHSKGDQIPLVRRNDSKGNLIPSVRSIMTVKGSPPPVPGTRSK